MGYRIESCTPFCGVALHLVRSRRADRELYRLGPENGMFRGEAHFARCLSSTDPHRAGTSNEGERVVADELRWPFEREGDGSIGVGANGTELVGGAEDDARRVRSVGAQFQIVGKQNELAVGSAAGEGLRDDLLAADEPVDAKVAPNV